MTNLPRPKKSLGQNFLIDQVALEVIAGAAQVSGKDTIVEIGPGHGELTEKLLKKKPKKLIAIEKDKVLANLLAKNFQFSIFNFQSISNDEIPERTLIVGDALDVIENWKLRIGNSTNWKLVGNIPYYITGYLMRIIGELAHKPDLIVLTTQKEVAERIAAEPPQMNLLAASVQFWGKPEVIGIISRKAFNPAPKVDSAVIRIVPSDEPLANSEEYYKAIKLLFKQPRKTVLNNLRDGVKNNQLSPELAEKIIKNFPELIGKRPQDLSIENMKELGLYFGLET